MLVEKVRAKVYTIEFEYQPEYLYAFVEGDEDSLEITRQFWSELLAECKKFDYRKLLIEENISENVTASEVYEFAKELPNMGFDGISVAFVDRQADHEEINRFGGLVAHNRGMDLKVFEEVQEAKEWLLSK